MSSGGGSKRSDDGDDDDDDDDDDYDDTSRAADTQRAVQELLNLGEVGLCRELRTHTQVCTRTHKHTNTHDTHIWLCPRDRVPF